MRLPSLTGDTWNGRVRVALAVMLPTGRHDPRHAGGAMAPLGRHSDLTGPFLASHAHLVVRSTLPPRLHELAILRAARRRGRVRARERQGSARGVEHGQEG